MATPWSSRKGWNRPMALEPPPMQATSVSGRRPSASMHLLAHLLADDGLEVAHHGRIGMRAGGRADDVVGVAHVGDPVAQRLVHGVLQGLRAGGDGVDLGAQQLHAEHVGLLALDVDRAHEDLAGHVELGAHGGHRDAVLAGAGLGDDARLAHALGEQDLAEAVVDLVAAGVVELVALEVDLGAARGCSRSAARRNRAGSAGRRSAC